MLIQRLISDGTHGRYAGQCTSVINALSAAGAGACDLIGACAKYSCCCCCIRSACPAASEAKAAWLRSAVPAGLLLDTKSWKVQVIGSWLPMSPWKKFEEDAMACTALEGIQSARFAKQAETACQILTSASWGLQHGTCHTWALFGASSWT